MWLRISPPTITLSYLESRLSIQIRKKDLHPLFLELVNVTEVEIRLNML